MQTDVTSIESNSVALNLTASINIPDLFSASASATFSYTQMTTTGQSLIESYSGSQAFTQQQGFTTTTKMADNTYTTSATP